MFNLMGKTALVTGVNDRGGMGKSHALALAKSGANIVVTGKKIDELKAVSDEIEKFGVKTFVRELDVTDLNEIERVFAEVSDVFGGFDILVNNAGVAPLKPAFEITLEDWDTVMAVNLKGSFFCAQQAARHMSKRNRGRIINIASVSCGQVGVGLAGGAHYTASKGGIVGMTESLAVEWAGLGITVNAIAPTAVETPMILDNPNAKDVINKRMQRIPLGRLAKPEEISSAVVFLASDEASYITGSTIFIDGGFLSM